MQIRKKNKKTGYYELNLENPVTFDDLKEKYVVDNIKHYYNEDNCFAFIENIKKSSYRTLIYNANDFDKKEYSNARKSVNKGLNKRFNISGNLSFYDAASKWKINIAIIANENESLDKYLKVPADKYLGMAVPLFNVVIVNGKLYIPKCTGNYFSSAFSYDKLAKKVFDIIEF